MGNSLNHSIYYYTARIFQYILEIDIHINLRMLWYQLSRNAPQAIQFPPCVLVFFGKFAIIHIDAVGLKLNYAIAIYWMQHCNACTVCVPTERCWIDECVFQISNQCMSFSQRNQLIECRIHSTTQTWQFCFSIYSPLFMPFWYRSDQYIAHRISIFEKYVFYASEFTQKTA